MMATFEVTEVGTLKAWHDIGLDTEDDLSFEMKICFHLTDEGIIVDIMNRRGEVISTFAATPDEFAEMMFAS
jgi:hypothetical protein